MQVLFVSLVYLKSLSLILQRNTKMTVKGKEYDIEMV
jgi:hypothetical protein